MFLQEWAMAMNINVHAYRCRSGPMVSLRSKTIHDCQYKKKKKLPHMAGLKENTYTERYRN